MKYLLIAVFISLVGCKTAGPATTAEPAEPSATTCRCEDGCVADCPVEDNLNTSYRKVVRDPNSPKAVENEPADAFSPLDVGAGEVLDEGEIDAAASALSRSRDELVGGFSGDFIRGRGTEHVVLTSAGELVLFRDGATFATLALGTPAESDALQAVNLVDDRLEIVVRHREQGRDRLTVCRVIGRAVGRVFDVDLDGRTVEFVHLGEERAIRVNPSDGPAVVFRWNPWEGMFRVPAPAPTAPPS